MYRHASRVGVAVIALAAAASVVSAQGAQAVVVGNRTTFGIMAGGNFAKLSGDDAGEVDRRTAFMAGVYADMPVGTSGLSIQPRLLYSMEGAKLSNIDGNGTDATLKADYIRVPVLLRYALPTSGGVRPFLALGPSFGLQTGCKVKAENGGSSASETCDDINTQLGGGFEKKSFDVSGDFEVGLAFPAGSKSVSIGGIFSQGFTDTFKDSKTHNQVISVFVGLGF